MMPIVLKQRQTEGQRTRQLGRYGRLLDKLFHILTSLFAVFVLGIVVAILRGNVSKPRATVPLEIPRV
jgi:hypothetical protein